MRDKHGDLHSFLFKSLDRCRSSRKSFFIYSKTTLTFIKKNFCCLSTIYFRLLFNYLFFMKWSLEVIIFLYVNLRTKTILYYCTFVLYRSFNFFLSIATRNHLYCSQIRFKDESIGRQLYFLSRNLGLFLLCCLFLYLRYVLVFLYYFIVQKHGCIFIAA